MSGQPWIIFDMDGVVTSEDGYWRAAACALLDFAVRLGYPAPEGEDLPWQFTPDLAVIARAKALLINTNWDLCHLAAMALAMRLSGAEAENLRQLRQLDWKSEEPAMLRWPKDFAPDLNSLVQEITSQAGKVSGFELMEELAERTGAPELFTRKGPVWQWLFIHFQEWFNGRPGRRGIVEDERLLRAPSAIGATLHELREAGWRLGIATGRTREELVPTLMRFDLLRYFEQDAVVTHDEVAAAEAEVGRHAHLSKPNPFPFLRALFPQVSAGELVTKQAAPAGTVVVGDTVADIAAAVTIGALPVGVLTGPGGSGAGEVLTAAGAQVLIADVLDLPRALAGNAGRGRSDS